MLRVLLGLAGGRGAKAGASSRGLAVAGGKRDELHHVERDVFVAARAACNGMSAFVHDSLAEWYRDWMQCISSCIRFDRLRFNRHVADASDDQIGVCLAFFDRQ